MCLLGALCCACGVLASWLLFTSVPARCVVLRVRCPRPLGFRSAVCPLGGLLCVCGVLGHLAPVHRCPHCVCCVVRAVFWPLGSCSSVCPLGVLCCVYGVLGHLAPLTVCLPGVLCGVLGLLAPVHRCARSVCCAVGCVSGASLRGALPRTSWTLPRQGGWLYKFRWKGFAASRDSRELPSSFMTR